MGEKMQIEKLSGSNFPTWKFKVKLLMIHKDVWQAVDPLNEGEVSSVVDQKALAVIGLSVQNEQIVHIQSCSTAKEAWESLQKVHEDSGTASKIVLQDQLMTTKLESGKSVKDHIAKFRSVVSQPNSIDVLISDEQYIIILLRSFTDDYSQLVVTLENIPDLKVEDGHARIVREEMRKTLANDNSEGTALRSTTTTRYKGHIARQKNDSKRTTCFYCGKEGHRIKDCYSRKNYHERNQRRRVSPSNTISNRKNDYAMMATTESNSNATSWIIDSGASHHIVGNKELFVKGSLTESRPISILLGTNERVSSYYNGTINLCTENGTKIKLVNVLYCPEIRNNLLSVLRIQEKGYEVIFKNNTCYVHQHEDVIFQSKRTENSFLLHAHVQTAYADDKGAIAMTTSTESLDTWHKRLGHLNKGAVQTIVSKNLLDGIDCRPQEQNDLCVGCTSGKMLETRFPIQQERSSTEPADKIHTDVCGPINPPTYQNARYFITFSDDWSRMLFTYTLKKKSGSVDAFNHFHNLVRNQMGNSIKRLKSDNGGEYMNGKLKEFLSQNGIIHESSPPYTPQMNGVSERINRTLVEMIRSMLYDKNCPLQLWGEALRTATYLINLQPKKLLDMKTPFEIWHGRKPSISHIRVFGSPCLMFIHRKLRTKLQPTSKRMVFLGYTNSTKVYRLMDPTTKKVSHSAKVIFEEHEVHNWSTSPRECEPDATIDLTSQNTLTTPETNDNSEDETNSSSHTSNPHTDHQTEPGVRRSNRARTNPNRLTYEHCTTDDEDDDVAAMMAVDEPCSVQEALDSEPWRAAMEEEYSSLMKNDTWTLCPRPTNRKVIKSRWIFKIKPMHDGSNSYKARLVAKGFQEQKGIDYKETFAPVIRLASIRLLLSTSISNGFFVHQMDAKSAFLNGELEEEIYMEQPTGFTDDTQSVCKLRKAIYGLKQAPRQWFEKINHALSEIGLQMNHADNGLYYGVVNGSKIILGLYVDDMIIAGGSMAAISEVKGKLADTFEMKDMGPISTFLNIDVDYNREKRTVRLSQEKAIQAVLLKFGMQESNPTSTPMTDFKWLTKKNDLGRYMNEDYPYREAIGSIMFIMLCTRPDICFAVCTLSKYLSDPAYKHWIAVKRLLRYLKGSSNFGLEYTASEDNNIFVYGDSDWANGNDRKSVSGVCVLHNQNLITWASKKQGCISLSTAEAELIAASDALKEGLWIRKLMMELDEVPMLTLLSDNEACLSIIKGQGQFSRTKHIDIRYLFIQEQVQENNVKVIHCPGTMMKGDQLTKPLGPQLLQKHRSLLGIIPQHKQGEC